MSNSDLLEYAILSMDVYHRGQPGGIKALVDDTQIDDSVRGVPADEQSNTDYGFVAQTYSFGGKTVIVYRGTDDGSDDPRNNGLQKDAKYGYSLAIGTPFNAQSDAAIDFYRSVAKGDPLNANIVVAGQSLGGGLAGYVASLYGKTAYVYDAMPFKDAVTGAFNTITGTSYTDPSTNQLVEVPPNEEFRQKVYGEQAPSSLPEADLKGAYVDGEAISYVTSSLAPLVGSSSSSRPYDFETKFDAYDPDGLLDKYTRHTSSTLVTLMFGEELSETTWHSAMTYLWRSWTNNEIGKAVGHKATGPANNLWQPADIMAVEIAYSAVDSKGPFGTAAIRSLFHDANQLGALVNNNNMGPVLGNWKLLEGIGAAIVQFAADVAKQKSTAESDTKGIVTVPTDGSTVYVDFDPARFASTFGDSGTKEIIGAKQIVDALLSGNSILSDRGVQRSDWGGSANDITKFVAATPGENAVTLTADGAPKTAADKPGGVILIGGNQNDTLQGGAGNDLLVGSDKVTTFIASAGTDLIVGGKENDTLIVDDSSQGSTDSVTQFFGGKGTNTADYSELTKGADFGRQDAPDGSTIVFVHGKNAEVLHDIQTIKLDKYNDTYHSEPLKEGNAAPKLNYDGSGGFDTATYKDTDEALKVSSAIVDGRETITVTHGADVDTFNGFEKIVGNNQEGTFDLSKMKFSESDASAPWAFEVDGHGAKGNFTLDLSQSGSAGSGGGILSQSSGPSLFLAGGEGSTFNISHAEAAGFDVLFGGKGSTFNISAEGRGATISFVTISGLTAETMGNLDGNLLKDALQNAGVNTNGIVIINPDKTDTLTWNGKTLSSPTATQISDSSSKSGFSDYLHDAEHEVYIHQAFSAGIRTAFEQAASKLGFQNYLALGNDLGEFTTNSWTQSTAEYTSYALQSNGLQFNIRGGFSDGPRGSQGPVGQITISTAAQSQSFTEKHDPASGVVVPNTVSPSPSYIFQGFDKSDLIYSTVTGNPLDLNFGGRDEASGSFQSLLSSGPQLALNGWQKGDFGLNIGNYTDLTYKTSTDTYFVKDWNKLLEVAYPFQIPQNDPMRAFPGWENLDWGFYGVAYGTDPNLDTATLLSHVQSSNELTALQSGSTFGQDRTAIDGANLVYADLTANPTTSTQIGPNSENRITGGFGNNSFGYDRGSGDHTLDIHGASWDKNKLDLTQLTSSDVSLEQSQANANDLVITLNDTGEQLVVANEFRSAQDGISEVVFGDGTSLNRRQLAAWVQTGHGDIVGAPAILDIMSSSGAIAQGVAINANTIGMSGTGVIGSLIKIFDNGTLVGSTVADATGHWSVALVALTEGANALTATASKGGATSATSAVFTATLDTIAPNAAAITGVSPDTGASVSDGVTNTPVVVISGTAEASSTVNVYDNGALVGTTTADANGAWTLANVSLTEGANALAATATDAAGNVSAAASATTVTLDTVAPNQAVIAGISPDTGSLAADGLTKSAVISVSGTAEAASSVAVYDNGALLGTTQADAQGAWSLANVTLSEGANALAATATDAAGNTGASSAIFAATLDTTAPGGPVVAGISPDSGVTAMDGLTNVSVVGVHGTAEANSTVALYDNGALIGTVQADGTGAWSVANVALAQGANALTATATDAAGNTSALGTAFTATLDTTAPTVSMSLVSDTGVSTTDGITSTAALKGTAETGSTVSIFDGSTLLTSFQVGATGTWSYAPSVADGAHAFSAVATDAAGNSSMASLNVVLDTQGPIGWKFVLSTGPFDDTASVAAGVVLGTIAATGDPNNSEFRYFFANDASGSGATQALHGLSIDAVTGAVTTTQALAAGSTTWVIAEDLAGHITAKPLVIGVGTSAANAIAIAAATTLALGLGGNDTITGTSGADVIAAGSGNDTIAGFVGADTVDGGSGTDTIVLTATSVDLNAAADAQIVNVEAISASTATTGVTIDLHSQSDHITTTGSNFADTLTGGSGADIINAGSGNDTINGFVGADIVNGGTGFDTLVLNGTSADLNVATNSQVVAVEAITAAGAPSGVTLDLHTQSDGFVVTGSTFNDVITGSSGADTISAGAGDDTIVGFVGADTVDGGAGTNTLILTATPTTLNTATDAQLTNVQIVSAAGASAGVTIDLHNQTESFAIIGSAFGDKVTGGAGADTITLNDGADTITNFVGADTLDGGLGVDTLVLTATSVDLNAATDSQLTNVEAVSAATATTGVAIDLHNQSEGFTLTGSGFADILTGTASTDIINGGVGDDIILGFVGADAVTGGTGFDTIVLTGTSAELNAATNAQIGTVEAITAAGAASGVTLDVHAQSDGFVLTGSAFNDVITGSTGADTINAGTGDDIIVNFIGADTIDGGAGTNTLVLTATSTTLTAATDAQLTNVQIVTAANAAAGVTIDLHTQTEGFAITGSAFKDTITGSSGADTITAGDGGDVVNGFVGHDMVVGGLGVDSLVLTATSADLNAASDTQLVSLETVTASTAAAGVTIDLHAQTDGFTLTGGAFNDVLTGSAGVDIINGGAGDDIIVNFVGADTVNGGVGFDTIVLTGTSASLNTATNAQVVAVEAVSAAGAASGVIIDLHSQSDGFVFTGSAFNDVLIGSSGADTFNAGGGANTMTGGAGADTFVFNADFVSGTITDFTAGIAATHDTLDIVFPGIDWNALIANNAMHQVGADTVIDLGSHGAITLKNVAKTALVVDDFKFV